MDRIAKIKALKEIASGRAKVDSLIDWAKEPILVNYWDEWGELLLDGLGSKNTRKLTKDEVAAYKLKHPPRPQNTIIFK